MRDVDGLGQRDPAAVLDRGAVGKRHVVVAAERHARLRHDGAAHIACRQALGGHRGHVGRHFGGGFSDHDIRGLDLRLSRGLAVVGRGLLFGGRRADDARTGPVFRVGHVGRLVSGALRARSRIIRRPVLGEVAHGRVKQVRPDIPRLVAPLQAARRRVEAAAVHDVEPADVVGHVRKRNQVNRAVGDGHLLWFGHGTRDDADDSAVVTVHGPATVTEDEALVHRELDRVGIIRAAGFDVVDGATSLEHPNRGVVEGGRIAPVFPGVELPILRGGLAVAEDDRTLDAAGQGGRGEGRQDDGQPFVELDVHDFGPFLGQVLVED